ncbi:hypothetical protein XU18_2727 [Perkinsela sp. CCAP 1560/4]|nr:hypothetical protein XU18_2727 [Perkinsela sp. CCAP 1560/4]|eukprot:KNH06222.1 hypothetical protein XU18_2727 [Perkinsela sp. CCAP 1560/4]
MGRLPLRMDSCMQQTKVTVSPDLPLRKSVQIPSASNTFKLFFPLGEGAEVTKDGPDRLSALDKLYVPIAQYDPDPHQKPDRTTGRTGIRRQQSLHDALLLDFRLLGAHCTNSLTGNISLGELPHGNPEPVQWPIEFL